MRRERLRVGPVVVSDVGKAEIVNQEVHNVGLGGGGVASSGRGAAGQRQRQRQQSRSSRGATGREGTHRSGV